MKLKEKNMSLASLLDIEGGIRTVFSSLSVSLSFNLMFIIGLSIEAVIILFFIIKSAFSYEMRATRALDRLNKWLFVNKKLTTDNIKEFTGLVKKGPKRMSYNWQQYILYREFAPSKYMTVENIVDKPLRVSSYDANVRNLGIFSYIFSAVMFLMGLAHSGAGETVLNTYLTIVAVSIPFIMLLMYGITKMCLSAKKHSNLDSLYQNLHLFQRFIDNACVDLPQFIDFTLLFSPEEIEKGIPALREFLESRARKEKEEFEKAKKEMVEYEKYDFETAGVDGSNILDRAMRESESYLNNKSKTLAKISQIEASLESLKKNFDNIQKDFQRKMQISKENIDRLRQSQEETTSRIESNYLRKQQTAELAKQEKEEADFEQQKRRYLVEKNDCEEEIKTLNAELDSGKNQAERAMLAEYKTFYTRICKRAEENVEADVRNELTTLKQNSENTEENLAQAETLIKRLEDENLTLRRKLEEENNKNSKIEIERPIVERPQKEKKVKIKPVAEEVDFDSVEEKPAPVVPVTPVAPVTPVVPETPAEPVAPAETVASFEEYSFDEPVEYATEVGTPSETEVKSDVQPAGENVTEVAPLSSEPEVYSFEEEVEYDTPKEEFEESATNEVKSSDAEPKESEEGNTENALEDADATEETEDEFKAVDDDEYDDSEEDYDDEEESEEEELPEEVAEEKSEEEVLEDGEVKRKRGRPAGSTKDNAKTEKRGRGRPRKEVTTPKEKRGRGRPVGSTKKVNSPSVKNRMAKNKKENEQSDVKRGRGRPRKNTEVETISSKIKAEEKKVQLAKKTADSEINEAIKGIDEASRKEQERQRLIAEIEELRQKTLSADESSPEELERISHQVEELLTKIQKLED